MKEAKDILNKISPQMSKLSPKEFDYIFKRGAEQERKRILKIFKEYIDMYLDKSEQDVFDDFIEEIEK